MPLRHLATLAVVSSLASPLVASGGDGKPLLEPLTNEQAWKAMPPAESGTGEPLPSWARMLSRSLPRTTAAVLQLDLAQRTKGPLDPKLRAAMRLVAAHANGSTYGEAYAAYDADRAGLSKEAIAATAKGDFSGCSADDRKALTFARKMTVESSKVSDEEFAALVKAFGEKKAAAMVLLMAYSNFQDRLLIVLGALVEEGGPMPPVEVSFHREALSSRNAPASPPAISDLPKPTGGDLIEDDASWVATSYSQLQEKLENQKRKPTRLKIPTLDEVMKGLPPGVPMQGKRVVWSLVAFGYCPELAAPWENVMWINGEENGRRFDRVFGLGLFWIVTRTIDCPYCMGHVEMNWEVIGMKPEQITATPSKVSRGDIDGVVKDFGRDETVSLLTYICRCNYMVRVSNGFQLSLERDNVFFDYYNKPKPTRTSSEDGKK